MRHPLRNSESSHYDSKEEPSIYKIEREYSTAAMMGAVEFNARKYKERLGEKSHIKGTIKEALDIYFKDRPEQYEQFIKDHKEEVRQSDIRKMQTYKDYGNVLKDLLHKGYAKMTVSFAMEQENIYYD